MTKLIAENDPQYFQQTTDALFQYNFAGTYSSEVINTGEYRYQVDPSAPTIYNWAQITGIAVSRYNRNGEDITPMIPIIVNSIIKIADIGTSTSLGYGLYRVTSSTSLSNGAAYLLTLEPRGAVSSVGNDVISLAPFGSGSFEYVEDFSSATAIKGVTLKPNLDFKVSISPITLILLSSKSISSDASLKAVSISDASFFSLLPPG